MGFFSKLFGKKEPVEQEPPYPSWVLDQSKMQDFANTLKQMARERNIPEKFIYGLMENDYSRDKLLFTAGLLEKIQGATFDQQIKAICDQAEKYWNNMDDKKSGFN